MKICDKCGGECRVAETRSEGDWLVRRRLVCEEGHSRWTVEMPEEVFNKNKHHCMIRLTQFNRGATDRIYRHHLRVRIAEMLADGQKHIVISRMLNCSPALVSKVATELRLAHNGTGASKASS